MNRRYTVEHYLTLVKKIRERIPNVGLSSDFIVGFPGETEEDFNATKKLVEEVKFDVIFAYMYSKRTGTQASKMTNQVEHEVKNRRVNELLNLHKEITKQNRQNIVGKTYNVLVEDILDAIAICKNDAGKTIEVNAEGLKPGQFINVKVISTNHKKTTGQLV